VALGKNALAKLMAAAGVQVVSKQRLDDRSDPSYCELEVALALRDFDGSHRQVIATKEMDLRPGAPETMKPEKDTQGNKTGRLVPYEASALADKRRHIQSHAETKAIERGLRLLFALPQKFKRAQLEKPFVVPKLVALDPTDPETKTASSSTRSPATAPSAPRPLPAHAAEVLSARPGTPVARPRPAAARGGEPEAPIEDGRSTSRALDLTCRPSRSRALARAAISSRSRRRWPPRRSEKVGARAALRAFPGSASTERHRPPHARPPKHPKLTAADVKAATRPRERAA
jgi:hypothetical protein